jgi:hypothetical protein
MDEKFQVASLFTFEGWSVGNVKLKLYVALMAAVEMRSV